VAIFAKFSVAHRPSETAVSSDRKERKKERKKYCLMWPNTISAFSKTKPELQRCPFQECPYNRKQSLVVLERVPKCQFERLIQRQKKSSTLDMNSEDDLF
jgi:hypothetical protein